MPNKTQFERYVDASENLPEIKINQRWVGYVDGEVYRRLRILAPHPDGGWIYCDEQAKMKREYIGPYNMGVCPEFNLRFIFELESEDE